MIKILLNILLIMVGFILGAVLMAIMAAGSKADDIQKLRIEKEKSYRNGYLQGRKDEKLKFNVNSTSNK